jgi:hypothetical protein
LGPLAFLLRILNNGPSRDLAICIRCCNPGLALGWLKFRRRYGHGAWTFSDHGLEFFNGKPLPLVVLVQLRSYCRSFSHLGLRSSSWTTSLFIAGPGQIAKLFNVDPGTKLAYDI